MNLDSVYLTIEDNVKKDLRRDFPLNRLGSVWISRLLEDERTSKKGIYFINFDGRRARSRSSLGPKLLPSIYKMDMYES